MEDLKCRIEPDYSWYQVDSHWECEREYELIYEILKSEQELNEQTVGLYYYIGTQSTPQESRTEIKIPFTVCSSYNKGEYKVYVYRLRLKDLSDSDWTKLKKFGAITIFTTQDIPVESGWATIEVEFPPETLDETLEEATLKKSSSTKYKCIWPQAQVRAQAEDTGDDQPSVAGYGIELKERLKDSNEWIQVEGIKAELVNGKYWIVKDNAYFEDLDEEIPEYAEKTFLASAGMAYIEGQGTTEAFFNPKELGLKKDSYYKFIVYPYINYSTYYDDAGQPQPGASLAPAGTESNELRYGGGTLRVKTADGWKEGQVWVYTSSGWKEAAGVYIKTADSWKESI